MQHPTTPEREERIADLGRDLAAWVGTTALAELARAIPPRAPQKR